MQYIWNRNWIFQFSIWNYIRIRSKVVVQYLIPKVYLFSIKWGNKHISLSLLYELKWYWTWYFDPVATEATVSIQGNSWCCLVSMFQCWFKVTERATNTWKYEFKYPSSDWGLLWIMLHHKHITHPMVT